MDFTNYLTMRSSNVATMKAAHLSLSTLTGSTLSLTTHITAPMAIYSTMMSSTIAVSTLTGSTLFGSTMLMSSIQTSFLTLSTLTVSSINNNAPGTGSFSTFTVSSLISVSSISSASTIYGSSLIITGNVGIGTMTPISQLGVHGNTSTAITVSNGFNAGFYTQYGLAHSAGQYSANSLAGDTVIEALGGNLIIESQNKNIYLSMPSTNTSNVLSIAGSGIRSTFSTAGWASLTNTQQYNNIALSWTAPVTCTISSISMYLGQGNNGTNISMYINGVFINEWWPFQGYGLYVINATGSSVANGVATTPTPFSALNQLVVQAGQVLTIYVSSLQTYNYFYYGRDSTTSGIGFSIVYNAPKVDLSLLNTATTLSLGLAGVGIGTTAPSANLHVHNSSSSFTGGPTVHIGDGQTDAGGAYGMAQLVRANNAADNKAHLSFIKNGLTVFGMGYYPGSNISAFGLVPSFSSMATANGLWILTNGNVGIGITNPTNRLDTFDGVARSGTHATGRALYATFNGAEYSNGIAEFRHTNGTQGVGIGYAGLYACGSNPDQEFNIIAKGTGLINLRSPMRLTGPGDNCMTYYGPNTSWNSYLVVGAGTDKAGGSTAQVISTNGNLHLDAGNGNVMYYGYYSTTRASSNSHQFYGNIYIANNISIGTTTVRYPLYIPGGSDWYWYLSVYMNWSGVPTHNNYGTWPVSIWTDRAIVTTYWFGTVSDQRIKKNIQPVRPMLETINKIEIVSFDFIDEPNNKRDECGVIAQQLETVFPNAVDKSSGIVPCYLKFATSQYLIDDDLHILFEYDTTDPQQNFKVGDKIKINAGQKTDTINKDKGSHDVIVKSIIDGGFVTEKWKDYEAEDGVFLHGKEVDDFRNVDKEQLGILALKGVQELSSMVVALQAANAATSSHLAALNGTCAALQAANAATSSQMAALQEENAQLKSQMAALMAWAQAQGFSG